jgi:hypothetical protein
MKTPEDYIKDIKVLCIRRNMSKEATHNYCMNVHDKLSDLEFRLTQRLNNTHEKINELRAFLDELKREIAEIK